VLLFKASPHPQAFSASDIIPTVFGGALRAAERNGDLPALLQLDLYLFADGHFIA